MNELSYKYELLKTSTVGTRKEEPIPFMLKSLALLALGP